MWLTPRATDAVKSQASVWMMQLIYVDHNDSSITAQQFSAEWLHLEMRNDTFYFYPSPLSMLQGMHEMIGASVSFHLARRDPLTIARGDDLLSFPLASAALDVSSDSTDNRTSHAGREATC